MSATFAACAPGYTILLKRMVLTRRAEIDYVIKERENPPALFTFLDEGRYKEVSDKTDIPQIVIATSFEREASSNFRLSPAQGDPWDRRSVNVPTGRGPFPNWMTAALDAYHLDHLDAVGKANWSWERTCFEEELFNGFGYRRFGINSPYLWAGTNNYVDGKYTSDKRFSRSTVDHQLGVIAMMYRMVQLRPDLALSVALPIGVTPGANDEQPPVAQPAPRNLHDASSLQLALNQLGADPKLDVDGNYGRYTRRAVAAFQNAHGLGVDGIAGPLTWMAINKALRE